jgi:hypothetical protein
LRKVFGIFRLAFRKETKFRQAPAPPINRYKISDDTQSDKDVLLVRVSAVCYVEMRNAFRLFDTNGDGRITVSELESVMDSLRIEKVSHTDVEKMIREADIDGKSTRDRTGRPRDAPAEADARSGSEHSPFSASHRCVQRVAPFRISASYRYAAARCEQICK